MIVNMMFLYLFLIDREINKIIMHTKPIYPKITEPNTIITFN